MSEPNAAHHLSKRTTPTWEVELLISGVAVFAMLQLPGWLDDRFFAMRPRLGIDWAEPIALIYIYAKAAAIILAFTFALHLLLRAHWIALVGMHSVYPEGVRWDHLRMGPIQRRVEQRLTGNRDDAIERADNRSTTVFALGVMLATVLLAVSLAVFLTYALGITVARKFGAQTDTSLIFVGCALLTMAPFLVANLIDRIYGDRIAPDGRLARVLAAVMSVYSRMGMGRWSGPMGLLASHESERKVMWLTLLIFTAACTIAISGLKFLSDPERAGEYALFPEAVAGLPAVAAKHYDDQRDPARDEAVPYVQSMVVIGPYLKLVVPYEPKRDATAMRKACLLPAGSGDAALAKGRFGCLQSQHAVTLDEKPLTGLHYEIASDPRTDRPALLAMIDVRALSAGRHELRVARPLRTDRKPDKDDPDPGFDTIPFWR